MYPFASVDHSDAAFVLCCYACGPGGIRGSFTTLKKLLQEQYKLTDLPDTAAPPEIPGGPVEAPAVPVLSAAAAPPAPSVPASAPAAPPLLGLADYIVYQELVASILRVSDPRMIAKGLAMFLTLLFIHVIITALQPLTQACSAAAAAGGNGSSLARLVCWPFLNVIGIPDSVKEVIGSMLMVAVANKLLVLGTEVLSAYLRWATIVYCCSKWPTLGQIVKGGFVQLF